MPKKYDLVEVDGMYGFITSDDISLSPDSSLKSFPTNRTDKTGIIQSIREDRRLYYADNFITKDFISFDHDRQYAPTGVTHYLGLRMTLDQFTDIPKEAFDREYARFREKYSLNETNYNKTNHGRLMRFVEVLEKGFDKLLNFDRTMEKANVSMIDSKIPGFKEAYEYANMRGNTILNALEDKIDERIDDLIENKPSVKEERHPSFDDLLLSASMRAAAQASRKAEFEKNKTQHPAFDERSRFKRK